MATGSPGTTKRLPGLSERSDRRARLRFFLRSVAEQAREAVTHIHRGGQARPLLNQN